jgi:hypothetical protein
MYRRRAAHGHLERCQAIAEKAAERRAAQLRSGPVKAMLEILRRLQLRMPSSSARAIVPASNAPSTCTRWPASASSSQTVGVPSGATRISRLLTILTTQAWPSTSTARLSGKMPRRAVGVQREARQATAEGPVHVEPLAARVDGGLVGVAQSVGHDGRAACIHTDDEAVVARSVITQRTRYGKRADGDPEAALHLLDDEVRGRQIHSFDALQLGFDPAAALQAEHGAFFGTEVRDEAAAVARQGYAVGLEPQSVGPRPGVEQLAAVGTDMGDAPAPVGAVHIVRRAGQHALGPHEPMGDEAQCRQTVYQRLRATG